MAWPKRHRKMQQGIKSFVLSGWPLERRDLGLSMVWLVGSSRISAFEVAANTFILDQWR